MSEPTWTEADRLEALACYDILDTPPEPAFDDAVGLVKVICQAPIALVSLVDAERQWFKAKVGVDASETAIDTSVCALAIRQPDVFIIEDLSRDLRTRDMSLVTSDPSIRFYAGAPLITSDGMPLGSLCAIDVVPRPEGLTAEQADALQALARQVVTQIEARKAINQRDRFLAEQERRQRRTTRDSAILKTILAAQQEALAAGGDIDTVLKALTGAALEAIQPADGVTIETCSADELVCRAAIGGHVTEVGARRPLAGSLASKAIVDRTVVMAAGEEDAQSPEQRPHAVPGSILIVPLSRRGDVVGVLTIQARGANAFRSRHVHVGQMVAALIGGSFSDNAEVAALKTARQTEANYRHIVDSAIDSAIISTNMDGLITSWSAGAQTIMGWTEAEMLGAPLSRIFTPEDRERGTPHKELAEAQKHGRSSDERWHIRKDGSRFYAQGAVTPLLGGAEKGFVKSLRDVTEQHETSMAFEASRQRLELTTQAAELGSFDFLPQTGVLDWDDRCRALFGMSAGAPVSYEDAFLRGLHPDDRVEADTAVSSALDPDGTGTFDVEYRTVGIEDGIERNILAKGLAFFVDGRPIRLIGTVQDVTADRVARARLRETEERFRLAVRATNDAIWDWDLQRDHVRWNDALYSEYGHDAGTVGPTGAWWLEQIHPDDRDRVYASIHTVIDGADTDWVEEYRFRRGDGTYADVRDRGYVIRDQQGQATRMLGALMDQSDRKTVERNLQAVNRRLETSVSEQSEELDRLWDTSPDLLLVIDFDGYLLRVNPAWTAILGYHPDELIGHHVNEFVIADDADRTRDAYELAAEGGSPKVENRYRHKDGSTQWFSWVAAPHGGVTYATGRHVTAEREAQAALRLAEDQLRHSQKVEAIGQLTGGVAHDFNNLLTVIRGSVDLLRRENLTEERRRRYIDAISETADRATKLTSQLLAFARRSALAPEVFDVGSSLLALQGMMETLTGSLIRMTVEVTEQPCHVDADPSQFDTAIVNMAVNARDAMDRQGDLSIKVQAVEAVPAIRAHPAIVGPFVAISIADTGRGIGADQVDQIFEPFFTTKSVGEGTGLGLSQVFGFAKQSGGEIQVQSTEGQGTTFTLYLPRTTKAVAGASVVATSPVIRTRSACVLVVEDNEGVGNFATQALAELGHFTVLARNGDEALAKLAAGGRSFDAVFSDVMMPGMTGIELAMEIRRLYPDLPVLLTSGYSSVLVEEGTAGFPLLHKPYSVAELAGALSDVIMVDGFSSS